MKRVVEGFRFQRPVVDPGRSKSGVRYFKMLVITILNGKEIWIVDRGPTRKFASAAMTSHSVKLTAYLDYPTCPPLETILRTPMGEITFTFFYAIATLQKAG